MTVTITYSRNILLAGESSLRLPNSSPKLTPSRLAVYTHLLLLSSSPHQNFWRWVNIFLTLGLWALELSIGGDDGARFKSE